VGAALLAAAAVDWLYRRATPVMVVAAVLAVFEMGSMGAGGPAPIGLGINPTMSMPINLPALDRPIAADHSNSIVVDIPLGIRSAVPIPGEGAPFEPEVQVQATADGHPRPTAYVSRMSVYFLNKLKAMPFYYYLFRLQGRYGHDFTNQLFGQHGQGSAELTAARNSMNKMHVRWAIMWHSNRSENGILRYLQALGFKFQYKAYGDSVYRLPSSSSSQT